MSNEIASYDDASGDVDTFLPASVFDTARFEQIMRVADVMARATTLPDHLKSRSDDRVERFEETRGNCFMICNQSDHWGMDPFSVAQATAFVYGKMCYEGKLIRAVIKKKLGFDLSYAFFGSPGNMQRCVYVSDQPLVDANGQPLSNEAIETLRKEPGRRITLGTLEKWHTKSKGGGINDNWVKDEDKMFRERGSREWCRQWAPGLMLGVYTPDEFDETEQTSRSNRARDVTSVTRSNPLIENNSVLMERINPETGEIIERSTGAQGGRTDRQTSGSSRDGESQASAKPAHQAGGETGRNRQSPQNSSSASSSQDVDDGTGGDASRPRLPSSAFTDYSAALIRFNTSDNVEKGHEAFWKDGGKPENTADQQLGKFIKQQHLRRVKGEIQIDEAKTSIEAAIAESYGKL